MQCLDKLAKSLQAQACTDRLTKHFTTGALLPSLQRVACRLLYFPALTASRLPKGVLRQKIQQAMFLYWHLSRACCDLVSRI